MPVLSAVNLDIHQGEFVALMGRSGSGKTTLLNILGLLDQPTSGTYELEGQSMLGHSSEQLAALRNQNIGFVFQQFCLLPRLTIFENIVLPLQYASGDVSDAYAYCRGLIDRLGLGSLITRKPAQLSGGQQQRVAICRALACRPRLILADEPTGALDWHHSQDIMALFKMLHEQEGLSIVMITHDSEVAGYAQRTLTLSQGRVHSGELTE